TDPRFPSNAGVIDLEIEQAELLAHFKQPPAHWWPLCGMARENNKPVVVHINARDYGLVAKGLSRIARAFPSASFIVDPFLCGKESRWPAGVCLADVPNIWITTRGLYSAGDQWPKRSDREAFYFVIGEVGVGKLL